jgi:hypothetical protein
MKSHPAGKISIKPQVPVGGATERNDSKEPVSKSSLVNYGQQSLIAHMPPVQPPPSPKRIQGATLNGQLASKRALDEQRFLSNFQKPMA